MRLDPAHHGDDIVRQPPGADDGDSRGYHDGRRIASGDHAEIRQHDREVFEILPADRTIAGGALEPVDVLPDLRGGSTAYVANDRRDQTIGSVDGDSNIDAREEQATMRGVVQPSIEAGFCL